MTQTQTKIKKGAFYHIESELRDFHETKREIVRLRNNIIYATPGRQEGKVSFPGDPTARTATILATDKHLTYLENMVRAIETVYSELPDGKKRLVELYYWTKPRTLTWDGIAQRIGVSRRQAFNWRNEIIREIAKRIGWR